jgi:hypothetical protein
LITSKTGATESAKSGKPSERYVVCWSAPAWPVMASRNVPAGMTLLLDTLSVEDPELLIDAGLTLAATPDGEPITRTVKLTAPLKAFEPVTVMMALPDPPGVIWIEPVEADTEKFGLLEFTGASALMKLWPFGDPQPVTRSKPVTALNAAGLPLLKLLPAVMSW